MEEANGDDHRNAVAGLLAFGSPVLLALISTGAAWLEQHSAFTLGEYAEWLVRVNAVLASIGSATGLLIVPGGTTRQRVVGIVGGAVSGFCIYMTLGMVIVYVASL